MSAPTYAQLGASTLARKWVFEVNTGTFDVPDFLAIAGITQSKFSPDTAHYEDDSTMDSQGAGSQTKTAGQASASITISRKVLAATGIAYDPAGEFVKSKAINKYGPDNTVQLRIFEFTPGGGPRVDAYLGLFGVGWEPQGGPNTALDTVQLDFQGQGLCAPISHPYPATAAAPRVLAVSPANVGVAGGDLVEITGSGFTSTVATTGVKFGGTNAAKWIVVSDGLIVATTPAKTAGAAQVVVTNATGSSSDVVNVTFA